MRLGIFTVASRGATAGDLYDEALNCYKDLADIVVVNKSYWPVEFSWKIIGEKFQEGYESLDTDWVIHADLDYIFHEKDFKTIRETLDKYNDVPALSFYKYQFILPDRYNLKSRLVIAVNKKKFENRIRFNGAGDLCQPTLDGKDLKPSDVPESGIPFYNYEKLIKTKEQITDDAGRMDRAYYRHFGKYIYGDGTNEKAYEGWLRMMTGRFNKPSKHVNLEDHPKYVQDTIKNLTSDKWGYSGFGTLEENDYV